MQLIFAGTIAVVLGFGVHALLPHRRWTGVLLLPAVSGAACCVVWAALTWAGLPSGGAVMWLASLGCALLSAFGLGVPLQRSRRRREHARLAAVA